MKTISTPNGIMVCLQDSDAVFMMNNPSSWMLLGIQEMMRMWAISARVCGFVWTALNISMKNPLVWLCLTPHLPHLWVEFPVPSLQCQMLFSIHWDPHQVLHGLCLSVSLSSKTKHPDCHGNEIWTSSKNVTIKVGNLTGKFHLGETLRVSLLWQSEWKWDKSMSSPICGSKTLPNSWPDSESGLMKYWTVVFGNQNDNFIFICLSEFDTSASAQLQFTQGGMFQHKCIVRLQRLVGNLGKRLWVTSGINMDANRTSQQPAKFDLHRSSTMFNVNRTSTLANAHLSVQGLSSRWLDVHGGGMLGWHGHASIGTVCCWPGNSNLQVFPLQHAMQADSP